MASVKLAYGTQSAFTITLASLASDGNLLAGRQSTAVSNTGNVYLDYIISGKIKVGSVAPTNGTAIEVWVYGAIDNTPTYPDVITGVDGNVTITSRDVLALGFRLPAQAYVANVASRTYYWAPMSLLSLFGCVPTAFGLFVVQSTGQALDATGASHEFVYTPVYQTVA